MWEDDLGEERAGRLFTWLLASLAVAALAAGGWYWWTRSRPAAPPPTVATAQPAAPAPAEPAISHRIEPTPGGAALPAVNDSDDAVRADLAGTLGAATVETFLVPQNIVRHVVATIDNLTRRKVAVELRPVKPTPGPFVTAAQGGVTTIAEANFARYAPFVQAVQAADVHAVGALYRRLYPLFQQAYEDLGYPGHYFNDRLIEVIDHLLATPEIPGPIALTQPKVFWEYADPALESRSAGQKLLLRMGPANALIIKGKLRQLRAEIARPG